MLVHQIQSTNQIESMDHNKAHIRKVISGICRQFVACHKSNSSYKTELLIPCGQNISSIMIFLKFRFFDFPYFPDASGLKSGIHCSHFKSQSFYQILQKS